MIKTYVEPKTRPTSHKLKWLDILRPFTGAIIGFLSFSISLRLLLWDVYSKSALSIAFVPLGIALLSPGTFVFELIFGDQWSSTHGGYFYSMLSDVVIFGVSVLPPTIIGFLIGSYNRAWRISGIILLTLYVLFVLFQSVFLLLSFVLH